MTAQSGLIVQIAQIATKDMPQVKFTDMVVEQKDIDNWGYDHDNDPMLGYPDDNEIDEDYYEEQEEQMRYDYLYPNDPFEAY